MDQGNTLSQMAQYDFGTPINVTMIFDDDNDDDSSNTLTNQVESLKEAFENMTKNITQNEYNAANINDNVTMKQTQLFTTNKIVIENSSNSGQGTHIPKTDVLIEDPTDIIYENPALINNITHEVTDKYTSEIQEQINGKKELTTNVKDLLGKLSENIIFIMHSYYCYYHNNTNQTMNLDALTKLKKYFFDLSYSSVVSLIIPREKNENFIQSLIDKTVFDVNKTLRWKCQRQHVERIYKEIIEWTKQRKDQLKKLQVSGSNTIEKNKVLKGILNNPTQSVNLPTDPQCSPDRIENAENSTCLFSYGAPGSEVSINLNRNVLIEHISQNKMNVNNNQHFYNNLSPRVEMKYPGHNTCPQSPTKHANVHYNPHLHHLQNMFYSKTKMHHYPTQLHPAPAYCAQDQHSRKSVPDKYQNVVTIQSNIAHTIRNSSTSFPTSPQNNLNDKHIVTHSNERGGPIISNVISLNPLAMQTNGICCVCGQYTNARCAKCNKFSYCSVLCQELDKEIHYARCGKS